MGKICLLTSGAFLCLAAVAYAQIEAPMGAQAPLPAVSSLNCEQMQAEMMVAGQQMNQHMDPNLGGDIQAMQADAQQRMQAAQMGMMGAGLMCAVPGLGMACTAAMNAQAAAQMAHADEDRARQDAVIASMQNSIAGIDQDRMTAISNRWESEHCEMSQQQ